MRYGSRQHGFATVLAMIFLVVFAALGVAFASFSNTNMLQADNHTAIQSALLEAESGLAFFSYRLAKIQPGSATGQDLLDSVAASLAAELDGSDNLQGAAVSYDQTTIVIPPIAVDSAGRTFSATVTLPDPTHLRLVVTGQNGSVTRSVSMDYSLASGRNTIFDYGIASKGPVRMTGHASIQGANDSSEANVLSATYSDPEAFDLTGSCSIEGDIYASNPDAYATLTGSISVGGETTGGDIDDHIHIGVGELEFPEVDPTVFEPFATNIVDADTSTTGNKTFNNIRILAGTNKIFTGNITLNGVIFIETPNQILFTGNTNITGTIITQDAGDNAYDSNTVTFTGNLSTSGVEDLPDTPEFHDLRQMPGSFILAPGFGLRFTGNFGTVNGCMAAEKFTWTGNAGGTVHGPIISYSDEAFSLTGNSHLIFDRSDTPQTPSGFSASMEFQTDASTYTEY